MFSLHQLTNLHLRDIYLGIEGVTDILLGSTSLRQFTCSSFIYYEGFGKNPAVRTLLRPSLGP